MGNYNPYENAQAQFDKVADMLEIDLLCTHKYKAGAFNQYQRYLLQH